MTKKYHSKKSLLCQLTLATTSILLLHSQTVFAEEQQGSDASVSQASPVVAVEATATGDNSQAAASNQAASEIEAKEEKVLSAFAEGTESSAPTNLSLNDSVNAKALQEQTQKGSGAVIAVIDVSFDPEHDAFKLDSDLKNSGTIPAKEAFLAKKQDQKITYGKWYNEKIIFAYDYTKQSDDIGGLTADNGHGNHTAAIAAGNGKTPAGNGLRVEGIAPNASLMLMKVTGAPERDQFAKSYAKAITDAVNLGATVISMSFGKTADSLSTVHEDVKKAIAYAQEKGVLLVAGAGNESAVGMGTREPLATNPDFGTLNSPAIFEEVISVAASNPVYAISQSINVKAANGDQKLALFMSEGNSFEANQDYFVADAKFGEVSHFNGSDVKGKVALIERGGSLSFYQKIENAVKAGAAGVIIYNNDVFEGSFTIEKASIPKEAHIPVGFMSYKDAQALKKGQSFTFNKAYEKMPSNAGGRVISQSSWGVTAEGRIKPDILAPGVNVYSAVHGNQYDYKTGTSMSTPMVSGLVAMLHKAYKEKFPELSDKELSQLVRAVLMSSARTLYSTENKAYISPRQQGAGEVDGQKALAASYYLTDQKQNPKINLGNIADEFVINLNVNALSKNQGPKKLYFQVNLITDQTKDGHFTLQPKALKDSEWQEINITEDQQHIQVSVDAKAYAAELLKAMPNGYFLEGFVRFTDNLDTKEELMSIPFSGFRGDFANLPALDTPIYETLEQGAFYQKLEQDPGTGKYILPEKFSKLTALIGQVSPYFLSQDTKNGTVNELGPEAERYIILGTQESADQKDLIAKEANRTFLISPNDDGNKDFILFQGVFLRSVKDIKAQVLDHQGQVVWESDVATAQKYYQASAVLPYRFEHTKWSGKDANDQPVADGSYTYRVWYTPIADGAEAQKQDFKVQVKTSLPELPKSASYDESTRTLKIDASNFPAYRIQVGHIVEIGEGEEADIVINYFQLAEDGTVIIPKTVTSELSGEEVEVDMAALKVIVEDEFGNFNAIALADLLKQKEPEIKDDKQPEPETPMPEQPKGNDSSKEQQSPKGNNSGSKQPLVMKQDSAVKPMTSSPSYELPKTSEKQGSSLLAGLGMLLASLSLGLFKKKSDN
ncbi:TPA: S8 family serine peptidase [Streptococcus equi subsp. zooepidemicus]|nr:S8 family serine peptidase [Streptococcus equi subsp. zooepidemicus]